MLVMASLAHDPERVRAAAEIASVTGVAQPTVSKLLKSLAKASLVESFRGVSGGYRLAHKADDLSVAQIISALEGPIALTECSADDTSCVQSSICGVRGNWQTINDAVRGALEKVSLTQFAQPHGVELGMFDTGLASLSGRKVIPITSVV